MQSGAKKFNFKMKEEESTNGSSDALGVLKFHHPAGSSTLEEITTSSNVEGRFVLKGINETKQIKRKKYNSKNYFGVKNHVDLFEVGKHYTNLSQSGMKSLAFYGNKQKSVHHTMLGLASFFNYHKGMKATIFVDKFAGSDLANFLKPTHIEAEMVSESYEEDTYEIYACDGIMVIELYKMKHLAVKMGTDAFQEFLEKIVADSEVVFWDLPKSETINKEREFYLPILNVVDSLSLVVDTGITKIKEIKEMNIFASKYQVALEGVLLYKGQKR